MMDGRRTDWNKVAGLGMVPDRIIAERLGVSRSSVAHARRYRGIPPGIPRSRVNIDWDREERLGMVPDRVIASALGVSVGTVLRARKSKGIPHWRGGGIDWQKVDFTLPDKTNAKKLGVSTDRVKHNRMKRGIFRRQAWFLPGSVEVTTREVANVWNTSYGTTLERMKRGWLGAKRVEGEAG